MDPLTVRAYAEREVEWVLRDLRIPYDDRLVETLAEQILDRLFTRPDVTKHVWPDLVRLWAPGVVREST